MRGSASDSPSLAAQLGHASQCAIEVLLVAQTRRLINLAEVSRDQLEPR